MLVLSRRLHEKILFPGINATIEVVSSKGGVVRLGIEAPPDVAVLREEIAGRPDSVPVPRAAANRPDTAKLLDQLRDRLRVSSTGLGTARLLLDTGSFEDARRLLDRIHEDLQFLRRGVDGERDETPSPSRAPRPRKALLVEDDLYQRELLAGFLRMAGLKVDTAGDGSDALDYLHSQARPDVVLMDMGLPRCKRRSGPDRPDGRDSDGNAGFSRQLLTSSPSEHGEERMLTDLIRKTSPAFSDREVAAAFNFEVVTLTRRLGRHFFKMVFLCPLCQRMTTTTTNIQATYTRTAQ